MPEIRVMMITTVSQSLAFLAGQPKFLESHGFHVQVVCNPDSVLQDFAEREGVRAIGVPMERRINPVSDLRSVAQLVRIMRREKVDIVHAHTPKGGLLGMISAKIAGVPIRVYQIHGFPYMGLTGWRKRLLMTTERLSYLLASQVLCVSPSIASVAVDDRIVSPGKIKVLAHGSANGVDALGRFNPSLYAIETAIGTRAEFGIAADAPVVIYIGRLARDKGIQDLAVAWKQVQIQHPESVLMLLGSLDERDPIDSALTDDLRTDESVILAGHQSNVPLFLAMSDILVLPTYREGYPTVLLEAAAMAIPAVATDVPGCVDALKDAETGILVPARAPEALAEALGRLLSDAELRRTLGEQGRQRVLRDYAPEKLWGAYMTEYCRLAGRDPKA